MALAPRDVPVTREQVQLWLENYKLAQKLPTFTTSIRDYLTAKIAELNLPDDEVDTRSHDDLEAVTSVVDMILLDLESYGY